MCTEEGARARDPIQEGLGSCVVGVGLGSCVERVALVPGPCTDLPPLSVNRQTNATENRRYPVLGPVCWGTDEAPGEQTDRQT